LDLQRPASSNYGCVIDMSERLNLNEIDEIAQKLVVIFDKLAE
jgi:hypothetical protein